MSKISKSPVIKSERSGESLMSVKLRTSKNPRLVRKTYSKREQRQYPYPKYYEAISPASDFDLEHHQKEMFGYPFKRVGDDWEDWIHPGNMGVEISEYLSLAFYVFELLEFGKWIDDGSEYSNEFKRKLRLFTMVVFEIYIPYIMDIQYESKSFREAHWSSPEHRIYLIAKYLHSDMPWKFFANDIIQLPPKLRPHLYPLEDCKFYDNYEICKDEFAKLKDYARLIYIPNAWLWPLEYLLDFFAEVATVKYGLDPQGTRSSISKRA